MLHRIEFRRRDDIPGYPGRRGQPWPYYDVIHLADGVEQSRRSVAIPSSSLPERIEDLTETFNFITRNASTGVLAGLNRFIAANKGCYAPK